MIEFDLSRINAQNIHFRGKEVRVGDRMILFFKNGIARVPTERFRTQVIVYRGGVPDKLVNGLHRCCVCYELIAGKARMNFFSAEVFEKISRVAPRHGKARKKLISEVLPT